MRQYFIILSFLFFNLAGFAQGSGESRDILDRTYSDYIESGGIKLSFSNTTTEANGNVYDPQKGEAFIKGDKFRIEMDEMIIWFDGTTQWVLLTGLDEVNISNPSETELASVSPLALLGIYREGFDLNKPVLKTINEKVVYQIDMTPVSSKGDIKAISAAVDRKNNTLVQVTLTMSNNLQNKIDISNYNSNYKFIDNEFAFNKSKYPGVEVVDLR